MQQPRIIVSIGVVVALATAVLFAACTPPPAPPPAPARAVVETVTVKDPEAEARAARTQLRLLEADALNAELESELDEARQEVVRAMAKLQTVASRAEAASGIAEAQIALDSLKPAPGAAPSRESGEVARLLNMSTAEFDRQNYGGALYLANQAKNLASAGRSGLASSDRGEMRPGETQFALPLPLRAVSLARVHEGPGSGFKLAFTLPTGAPVMAYAYVDAWVRIADDQGRSGWAYYSVLGKRQE